MTVRELRKRLEHWPGDMEVWVTSDESLGLGTLEYGTRTGVTSGRTRLSWLKPASGAINAEGA